MSNLLETIVQQIEITQEKYLCKNVDIYIDTRDLYELLKCYSQHLAYYDENGDYRIAGHKVYPVGNSGHLKIYPSR